jgi:hypothetical protein
MNLKRAVFAVAGALAGVASVLGGEQTVIVSTGPAWAGTG